MSAESGDGYPLVLHSEADPSRLGGTAVCGFSTVGSVGVIATSHLISSLQLSPMGTVLHPQFPAVALIHDSVPKHPVSTRVMELVFSHQKSNSPANTTSILPILCSSGSPKVASTD